MNEYEAVSNGDALGPMESEGDHLIVDIEQPGFAKPSIFICGPSGSGKTTSLRNLDPESTFVLNLERKALPFRNARKFRFTKDIKDIKNFNTFLKKALESPKCKYLVIDSFTSLTEMIYSYCAKHLSGYDLWEKYRAMIHHFLLTTKTADKYVIWIGLDERTQDVHLNAVSTIAVQGSLKGRIGKEFVICFFSEVQHSLDSERPRYVFLTNSDGIREAKSPMEMFSDLHIDNDLNAIIKRIEKYYLETI